MASYLLKRTAQITEPCLQLGPSVVLYSFCKPHPLSCMRRKWKPIARGTRVEVQERCGAQSVFYRP